MSRLPLRFKERRVATDNQDLLASFDEDDDEFPITPTKPKHPNPDSRRNDRFIAMSRSEHGFGDDSSPENRRGRRFIRPIGRFARRQAMQDHIKLVPKPCKDQPLVIDDDDDDDEDNGDGAPALPRTSGMKASTITATQSSGDLSTPGTPATSRTKAYRTRQRTPSPIPARTANSATLTPLSTPKRHRRAFLEGPSSPPSSSKRRRWADPRASVDDDEDDSRVFFSPSAARSTATVTAAAGRRRSVSPSPLPSRQRPLAYIDLVSDSDSDSDDGPPPALKLVLSVDDDDEPEMPLAEAGMGLEANDDDVIFTSLVEIWSRPRGAGGLPSPFPPRGPLCLGCGDAAALALVSQANINGNAGRPFYRCAPCRRFVTWADLRGVAPTNPACRCGAPSRENVTGVRARCGPGVRYRCCAEGRCDFREWPTP